MVSITSTKIPAHYTIVSSYNMDSIPGECEALGLVVFSNIIFYYYLFICFIINDIILTAFFIVFSTWLYNY